MKDIKSLYLAAKASGNNADIAAYNEAVNEAFTNNPSEYILQLEYIIQSSVGIETFVPFVEKYGLPICLFEKTYDSLANAKKKMVNRGCKTEAYDTAMAKLDAMHEKYAACFVMHDYITESVSNNYVDTYYHVYGNGHTGRLMVKGMYESFGEEAVMDLIITADSIGENALNTTINFLSKVEDDPVFNEVVNIAIHNLNVDHQFANAIYENSSSFIADRFLTRHDEVFRESALSGEEVELEYSYIEIESVKDKISLLEYCMCAADELDINIDKCYSQIMKLYESIEDIIEEDSIDIAAMLPQQNSGGVQPAAESIFDHTPSYVGNTRNKKTSAVPKYMAQNHDILKYGEDDTYSDANNTDDDQMADGDKTLEDYRRPSSINQSDESKYKDEPKEDSPITKKSSDTKDNGTSDNTGNGTYNYYYYNYNNSLNKNSNSFNRDSSSHDDHSHKNRTDDHSSNKRIRSHDYGSSSEQSDQDDEDGYAELESNNPWGISINQSNEYLTEMKSQEEYAKEAFKKKYKFEPSHTDPNRGTITVDGRMYQVILDSNESTAASNQTIRLGKEFWKLKNPERRDAVLQHEIGHIRLGHTNETNDEYIEFINNPNRFPKLRDAAIEFMKQDPEFESNFLPRIKKLIDAGYDKYQLGLRNGIYLSDHKHEILKLLGAGGGIKNAGKYIPKNAPRHLNPKEFEADRYAANRTSEKAMRKALAQIYRMGIRKSKNGPKDILVIKDKNARSELDKFVKDHPYYSDEEFHSFLTYLMKKYHISLSHGDFSASTIDQQYRSKALRDKDMRADHLYKPGLYESSEGIIIDLDFFDEAGEEAPAIGSADDSKPKSDHPIKDAFQDLDRKTVKIQQGIKKGVQDVQNVGRAAAKPIKRAKNWIDKTIADYKDANETNIKEKLWDPQSRNTLYELSKKAIEVGALYKAGLLLNPIFLMLAATKAFSNNKKIQRIRNEMIGEIKQEIEIINAKIEDTGSGLNDDPEKKAAKYKLMRTRNELQKKLMRVAGGKRWAKNVI